jgi:hypothetical protein
VWHFEKRSTDLFHPFINALYKAKLEASGFPSNVSSEREKKMYVEEIRQKEGVELELQKIAVNPGRRQMAKILLNSFWGKFAQRENLTQVEFINTDVERFNELLFSDNIYKVLRVTPITDDIVYVVYRNIFNKPNPKGNIFIAAFTTAHARLHLYEAVSRLDRQVVYMDTDSVVFRHFEGLWTPHLGNFLGEWTNEVAEGWDIISFTTCGPKNYSYTLRNSETGETKVVLKVKGLRLTKQAHNMIDQSVMNHQVQIFGSKRPATLEQAKPVAKKPCLVKTQKKCATQNLNQLNSIYVSNGAKSCLETDMAAPVSEGPCNCKTCVEKHSVTVAQVCFRKHQSEGYVETQDVRKEYQLVLNKRWLLRESADSVLPLRYLTLPFGFGHTDICNGDFGCCCHFF